MTLDNPFGGLPSQGVCGWCGQKVPFMAASLGNDIGWRRVGLLHWECALAVHDAMKPPPSHSEQRRIDARIKREAAKRQAEG